MFAYEHIKKEDRKLTRVTGSKFAGSLLLCDPLGDDLVRRIGPRFIKERTDRGKRLANRHHQAMQLDNLRVEHRLQEVAGDLCQLRLRVAHQISVDRVCDVNAGLPDNGFEQTLLATKSRIQRRFRSADQPDDFVDSDVRITLLDE